MPYVHRRCRPNSPNRKVLLQIMDRKRCRSRLGGGKIYPAPVILTDFGSLLAFSAILGREERVAARRRQLEIHQLPANTTRQVCSSFVYGLQGLLTTEGKALIRGGTRSYAKENIHGFRRQWLSIAMLWGSFTRVCIQFCRDMMGTVRRSGKVRLGSDVGRSDCLKRDFFEGGVGMG